MSDLTSPKVNKSDADWREQLTPEQYRILREHGTERPFTGPYWDTFQKGLYRCAACDEPFSLSSTFAGFPRKIIDSSAATYFAYSPEARRFGWVIMTLFSAIVCETSFF